MDRYVVVGNPIAHSRSPQIHQAFAEQVGQSLSYETLLGDTDKFEQQVDDFFAGGGKGMNVTLPFKERAYAHCRFVTQQAKQAGAVNTLWQHEGELYGHNTDGIGLVNDLKACLLPASAQVTPQGHVTADNLIAGKTLLVLGAGGAVRGVLAPLLACKPEKIYLVNRTVEKAKQLSGIFDQFGCIEACVLGHYPQQAMDIIINGTSSGLTGEPPKLTDDWLDKNTLCYDMVYGDSQTAFLKQAASQGAEQLFDGFGMLVSQAAAAFQLWTGQKVSVSKVKAELAV